MTQEREVLVAVSGASVWFERRQVLERVDLELHAGEVVTVIGPNGAGKSTLVKLVLGIIKPDAGTVERRRQLRVGYVPQRLNVDPTLPIHVEGFLALPGKRLPDGAAQVLDETGIAHLLQQPLFGLSGGEIQRVLLARALLRKADLLVLDEPGQGVDHLGQAEFYALIDRIRQERQCGVLIVSHDLHLVMAATDVVICLNRHVCCSGKPESVGRDPAFARLFGETAATSLAWYRHEHDHRHDLCHETTALPDRGAEH